MLPVTVWSACCVCCCDCCDCGGSVSATCVLMRSGGDAGTFLLLLSCTSKSCDAGGLTTVGGAWSVVGGWLGGWLGGWSGGWSGPPSGGSTGGPGSVFCVPRLMRCG